MITTFRIRARLAAALTAIALAAACGGVQDASDSQDLTSDLEDAQIVAPVEGMACEPGSETTGDPIVIGGSLSLTGPLAPTALVHDEIAKIVVAWVNECGGFDGRPIEWRVLDDQSSPAQAASNYERLLADGVDLVMGPYGGASTLAAAGPVSRAGYAFPTATNGAPGQLIGENHFPAHQFGAGVTDPARMFDAYAQTLVEALGSSDTPPETVFFANAKFPTTLSYGGAAEQAMQDDGMQIVGSVEYDLGTTDFSSIATRIASEDPDLVYLGAIGADVTNIYQAFDAIGYEPRTVYAAAPSPASISNLGERVEGILLTSTYENHAPLGDTDIARYLAVTFSEAAEADGLFPLVETQAAGGFSAWQILLTAVNEVGVDNAAIIEWLNANEVPTVVGDISFDGFNNYGKDFNRVTQVQDGKRVLVWPEDVAGAPIDLAP